MGPGPIINVIARSEATKQSHKENCKGLIHQIRTLMMRLPRSLRSLAITFYP